LEDFVSYQKNLNKLFEKVYASSDNFQKTGQDLKEVVSELKYLKGHSEQIFKVLTEKEDAVKSISNIFVNDQSIIEEWKKKIRKEIEDLDSIMQDNVEALADHTKQHFLNINKVMEKEFVHMERMFDQSQHRLENLDYLKYLVKLEEIQTTLNEPVSNQSSVSSKEAIDRLALLQTQTNELLTELVKERQSSFFNRIKRIGNGQKAK